MVGWHHQFNGHEFEQTLKMVKDGKDGKNGKSGVLQSMESQRVGHNLANE